MNNIKKFFQHNWFAIVYLNFKMLPFRQAVKLPIDIYYGIRCESLKGRIVIDSTSIYRGMIKIGSQGSDMFCHTKTIVKIDGCWIVLGSFVLGIGSSLILEKSATLTTGAYVILGARNLVYSRQSIVFGDSVVSSWDCQFMDTDTHYVIDLPSKQMSEASKGIKIGSHCWIGNHVSCNKGVVLMDNTIVASQSLCNRDYSSCGEHCIIGGIPAKLLSNNKDWIL